MGESKTLRQPGAVRVPAVRPARPARRKGGATAMAVPRPSIAVYAVPALLVATCLLFAIWQAMHVRAYTYNTWQGTNWSDYDEGVYLVSARLMNEGQALFSQVFSSQPPLFLGSLAVALRLAGGAAGAGHLYATACGLLALAGVAWLCWETMGRWSALLAVVVLALSPGFVIASRAVEAEAPMMALAGLAVASAARYVRAGQRRWLVAAALLLAAATLSKVLAAATIVPLAVALLMAAYGRRKEPGAYGRLAADGGVALLALVVPIAAAFLLLSPAAQYDQVVRFHLRASAAIHESKPSNLDQIQTLLGWDPGLIALALCGLAVAAVLRRPQVLLPLAWLLATGAPLVTYHPLFLHHLTVLLPPLAALAGGIAIAPERRQRARLPRITRMALAGAGLLAYCLWLPVILDHDAHAFVADRDGWKAARVGWLKAHTPAGATVVVDDQTIAVAANRLVPPALADTSIVRASAGYLPLSLLIDATSRPEVRAVLLSRRLADNGAYVAWLRRTFRESHPLPDIHALLFVPRPRPAAGPTQPMPHR